MLQTKLIAENGLRATSTGFDVEVRLPWYRGLPLSTVEIGDVVLNGEAINPASVSIEVNGKTRLPGDLATLYDERWYVLDSAMLHVSHSELKRGEQYDVAVSVNLRPPYIPGLTWAVKDAKRLTANS